MTIIIALVFYCCVTHYRKLEAEDKTPVLCHISEGQKSGQAQLFSLFRVSQGQSQDVSQSGFSSEGSGGRIHTRQL